MTVDELKQVTASLSTGQVGAKTFHKILRGADGKHGVQLILDVTELESAMERGCYKFTDKSGHKCVALYPKVWPPKEGKIVNREAKKEDTKDFLEDECPF